MEKKKQESTNRKDQQVRKVMYNKKIDKKVDIKIDIDDFNNIEVTVPNLKDNKASSTRNAKKKDSPFISRGVKIVTSNLNPPINNINSPRNNISNTSRFAKKQDKADKDKQRNLKIIEGEKMLSKYKEITDMQLKAHTFKQIAMIFNSEFYIAFHKLKLDTKAIVDRFVLCKDNTTTDLNICNANLTVAKDTIKDTKDIIGNNSSNTANKLESKEINEYNNEIINNNIDKSSHSSVFKEENLKIIQNYLNDYFTSVYSLNSNKEIKEIEYKADKADTKEDSNKEDKDSFIKQSNDEKETEKKNSNSSSNNNVNAKNINSNNTEVSVMLAKEEVGLIKTPLNSDKKELNSNIKESNKLLINHTDSNEIKNDKKSSFVSNSNNSQNACNNTNNNVNKIASFSYRDKNSLTTKNNNSKRLIYNINSNNKTNNKEIKDCNKDSNKDSNKESNKDSTKENKDINLNSININTSQEVINSSINNNLAKNIICKKDINEKISLNHLNKLNNELNTNIIETSDNANTQIIKSNLDSSPKNKAQNQVSQISENLSDIDQTENTKLNMTTMSDDSTLINCFMKKNKGVFFEISLNNLSKERAMSESRDNQDRIRSTNMYASNSNYSNCSNQSNYMYYNNYASDSILEEKIKRKQMNIQENKENMKNPGKEQMDKIRSKIRDIKIKKKQEQRERRIRMQEKLEKFQLRHKQFLEERVSRAKNEQIKLDEIAFIKRFEKSRKTKSINNKLETLNNRRSMFLKERADKSVKDIEKVRSVKEGRLELKRKTIPDEKMELLQQVFKEDFIWKLLEADYFDVDDLINLSNLNKFQIIKKKIYNDYNLIEKLMMKNFGYSNNNNTNSNASNSILNNICLNNNKVKSIITTSSTKLTTNKIKINSSKALASGSANTNQKNNNTNNTVISNNSNNLNNSVNPQQAKLKHQVIADNLILRKSKSFSIFQDNDYSEINYLFSNNKKHLKKRKKDNKIKKTLLKTINSMSTSQLTSFFSDIKQERKTRKYFIKSKKDSYLKAEVTISCGEDTSLAGDSDYSRIEDNNGNNNTSNISNINNNANSNNNAVNSSVNNNCGISLLNSSNIESFNKEETRNIIKAFLQKNKEIFNLENYSKTSLINNSSKSKIETINNEADTIHTESETINVNTRIKDDVSNFESDTALIKDNKLNDGDMSKLDISEYSTKTNQFSKLNNNIITTTSSLTNINNLRLSLSNTNLNNSLIKDKEQTLLSNYNTNNLNNTLLIENESLISLLEQTTIRIKFCKICNQVLQSEFEVNTHIISKEHKKQKQEYNITHLDDSNLIIVFHFQPGDMSEEIKNERFNSIKLKFKKVKQKIAIKALKHENWTSKADFQSTNKQRIQKICFDIEKMINTNIRDFETMELLLKELYKIIEQKKQSDLHLLRQSKIIHFIFELMKKPQFCHKGEIKALGKVLEIGVKVVMLFSNLRENRNYLIITNKITICVDLLLWLLNKPTKLPLGISFLPDLVYLINISLKHRLPYEYSVMKEELVEYVLYSNLLLKLKMKYATIQGPMDLTSTTLGSFPLFLIKTLQMIDSLILQLYIE